MYRTVHNAHYCMVPQLYKRSYDWLKCNSKYEFVICVLPSVHIQYNHCAHIISTAHNTHCFYYIHYTHVYFYNDLLRVENILQLQNSRNISNVHYCDLQIIQQIWKPSLFFRWWYLLSFGILPHHIIIVFKWQLYLLSPPQFWPCCHLRTQYYHSRNCRS